MRDLVTAVVHWTWRVFGPLLERLASVGLVQSAVVLAAQTFLALFPLLMAVAAIAPPQIATALRQTFAGRLGLAGQADQAVQTLLSKQGHVAGGVTVVGLLVVLASATAFTRSLQRVYENAWQVPRLGLRGTLRGVIWLVGLVAYLALLALALRLVGGGPIGSVSRPVLAGAANVLLWWLTPFVLLSGRVKLRALIGTGVLTGGLLIVLGLVSRVVMPRTIRTNEQRYGTIGVVFAVESWLVVVAGVIVAAAVVAAMVAQRTWGPRWVRLRVPAQS